MPVENSLPVTGQVISNDAHTIPHSARPQYPARTHPSANYTAARRPNQGARGSQVRAGGISGIIPPAAQSRVIASIIAAGLAMPLPAMSNALPCATDENRIGLPIANAADWLKASSFAAMWPWSCSITTKASTFFRCSMVSAPNGPIDGDAGRLRVGDRRRDHVDLLAPEQAAFAGMRIEPADADARLRDADAPQRRVGGADRAADPLAGDQRERLRDADMQRAMDDARVAEAQHEKHVVVVHAGLARHEGRVAVERDAGGRDRGLVVRRRHHGVDLAGARRRDRARGARERGAAIRRVVDAER